MAIGWFGNYKYKQNTVQELQSSSVKLPAQINKPLELSNNSSYKCDGRTHCSQMNSCEEATFFVKNCLDTKMDGNGDGIPCEKQWCK